MTIQRNTATRDGYNASFSTQLGTTSVTLLLISGAQEAATTTADTGTVAATLALPSTPLGTSSSGVISKSGTWTGTASASATVGHYRLKASGGTVIEQGSCGIAVTAATSAATSANGNVLTFASAPSGLSVGMTVSGTGVVAGCTIAAISGATVIMSRTSTAGVASAASITFGFDLNLDNNVIASGQTITISTYSSTAGDA